MTYARFLAHLPATSMMASGISIKSADCIKPIGLGAYKDRLATKLGTARVLVEVRYWILLVAPLQKRDAMTNQLKPNRTSPPLLTLTTAKQQQSGV